jgi:hypothetical protein
MAQQNNIGIYMQWIVAHSISLKKNTTEYKGTDRSQHNNSGWLEKPIHPVKNQTKKLQS